MSKEKLLELETIYLNNKLNKDIYLFFEEKVAIDKTIDHFNTFNEDEKKNVFLEYLIYNDKSKMKYEPNFKILNTNPYFLFDVFKHYKHFNKLLNNYLSQNQFEFNPFSDNKSLKFVLENIHCLNKKIFFKLIKTKISNDFLINNLHFNFNSQEKESLIQIISNNIFYSEFGLKVKVKLNVELKKMLVNKVGFFDHILYTQFNNNSTKEELYFFMEHVFKLSNEEIVSKIFENFFYTSYYYSDEYIKYDYLLLLLKEKPELYDLILEYAEDKKINLNKKFYKEIKEALDNLLTLQNF